MVETHAYWHRSNSAGVAIVPDAKAAVMLWIGPHRYIHNLQRPPLRLLVLLHPSCLWNCSAVNLFHQVFFRPALQNHNHAFQQDVCRPIWLVFAGGLATGRLVGREQSVTS